MNFFYKFAEPKCKCKCSPACKKRRLIIDVLLKYFFREAYDKECCKQECDCPEGSSIECEGSSNSKEENHEFLVKLFKSDDNAEIAVKEIETSDDKLDEAKKQGVADVVQEAMDKINSLLFGN